MRSLKEWWKDNNECRVCGTESPDAEFWDFAAAFAVFALGMVLGGLLF